MERATDLIELARHMAWADAVAWRSVLQSEPASRDARIRTWMHHVHVVQHAFHAVWRGAAVSIPEESAYPDLVALAEWGRSGHTEIQAWLSEADTVRLAQTLRVPWAAQVEAAFQRPLSHPTVRQTVLQVALHTTHHRAQVSARLRELGGEPGYTDFIVWLWTGQPVADWSFLETPREVGRG